VATIREDLARPDCAVILFDPKGDAADAALSVVDDQRTCTILDFAAPTCGFNPLAVDASPDVIADYVVAAMRNLFDEGDIRASSDRYLRNAIIAVLAFTPKATLWDAVRLLSVTDEGYAYRQRVGEHVRGLPEFKEIGEFFTQELRAQLRDAKTMTTSKLDAPVNKAARLLNSASIKRVLQNTSLTVDFDRIIAGREVLVVKGALGTMGAGNTSVLMQLLIGMLDAALARQQDNMSAEERVAVALKIDEAPLVINRGFAQTLALKRSAGLECVACWQTDAQWTDRDVRDQLDALFAHRVYFATASVADARAAADLLMAQYSDSLRPESDQVAALASPDVRLHLPKHWAIASWVTPQGRAQPFVAQTMALRTDPGRIARHRAAQHARGGRPLERFHQPHWDRELDDVTEDVLPPTRATAVAPDATLPPPAPSLVVEEPAATGRPEERGAGAADETTVRLAPSRARVTTEDTQPAPPVAAADLITFTELAAIDEARSVTWPRRSDRKSATPDALDLTLIAWLAELRFALATQMHRTFFADKSYSTTQRRLKRMHQAGWVERFQYFRQDGSSSPLVYLATDAGIKAATGQVGPHGHYLHPKRSYCEPATSDPMMRKAQHDVHVVAWVLALQSLLGDQARNVRGPQSGRLVPPWRTVNGERHDYGPDDLHLPGGRMPHGFLRTDQGRRTREPLTRFEAIEPDATVELRMRNGRHLFHTDLFVELDRTSKPSKNVAKFERYDHLITGWARHKDRHAKYLSTLPLVVFVCRDDESAREFCRAADPVVTACHSYAGEYPGEWEYAGRERMFFAAERAIHEGSLAAYALPRLPPEVRVAQADGDRRAAACQPRLVRFLAQ
jgi:Replication-relaxation